MQISGEDINQPRQSFICRQLKDPAFAHLTDTTWELVGHEKAATGNQRKGMFADGKTLIKDELQERIQSIRRSVISKRQKSGGISI